MTRTAPAPVDLPDINVWLALADGTHQHHGQARLYWEEGAAASLAYCRVTMLGFLRLITHPKAMAGRPFSPPEAWRAYRQFRTLPEITFLPEPLDVDATFQSLSDSADFPQPLWTDAYLAALAVACGCRLVSFDRDFRRFAGLDLLLLGTGDRSPSGRR